MAVPLAPGGPYYGAFPTPAMPGSVSVTDKFTATVKAIRNGVVDTGFALTATQAAQGYWSVYGMVPTYYVPGDTVAVFATLTDTTANPQLVIPILVDVVLVSDPKIAHLVAIAEARADARRAVLDAIESVP